jgi:hypothetical protein
MTSPFLVRVGSETIAASDIEIGVIIIYIEDRKFNPEKRLRGYAQSAFSSRPFENAPDFDQAIPALFGRPSEKHSGR